MAAVGGAVGGATPGGTPGGTPTPPAPTGTLPAGPYTNLGKGVTFVDGHTYLASAPASSGETVASAVAAFQSVGFTVIGSWASPPAGWPSDETLTSGVFIAFVAHGGGHQQGADVTTWAAGGAAS